MFLFLITANLNAQSGIGKDTIKINEVIISRNKSGQGPTGFNKTSFDSITKSEYSNSSLAEMLSGRSMLFVKNYGMSGTASVSLRGTGASQTLIDWNGININSPMLGQTDLSLIPVGLIDDVHVYYGGSSLLLNNGGIGGTINLETNADWKKETAITINPGFGSFGTKSGFMKVKIGSNEFQSVSKVFFQSSDNNFRYLDYNGAQQIWQTRTNSQVSQKGFIQEFYYKNGGNTASARVWYQTSDRNLPPPLLTVDNHEKQFDQSLRIMLSDNLVKGNTSYFITSALLDEYMNYTNKISSIDSRNKSAMLVLKAGSETSLGEQTSLRISFSNELCTVNTNNYLQKPERNNASLSASLEQKCNDRFGMTLLLSEILDKQSLLIPDFSTAFQFRLINNREYFLKASISRNSRIPTMNDLFWSDIGNPDLKNEYAYNYELTYKMILNSSSPLSFTSDISIFHNDIKNMIEWHPGDNAIWTVDNIGRVNSEGVESTISVVYKADKFTGHFNAGYSFTKASAMKSYMANDASVGKQLIYIPENQLNGSLRLSFGNFYSSWLVNLTGKEFTTSDDSKFLPSYVLNSIITGIKLHLSGTSIDLNLNIDNLFAVNYQTVAGYPLPGRSYFLKILFQFVK